MVNVYFIGQYWWLCDNNALLMRISAKKESPLRQSLQEHHLCRLLAALPNHHTPNRQHRTLTRPHPPLPTHQQARKERIKIKIKTKIREGLDLIASRELQRQQGLQQRKEEGKLPRSQFMLSKQPVKQKAIEQILSNCVIEPIVLHQNTLTRRTYKSRAVNSVLEMRNHAQSVLQRHSPPSHKLSVPKINQFGEGLQPWRYWQEGDDLAL